MQNSRRMIWNYSRIVENHIHLGRPTDLHITHLLSTRHLHLSVQHFRAAKTSFSSLAWLVWRGMRARGSVLLCGRSMFAEYEITAGRYVSWVAQTSGLKTLCQPTLMTFALVSQFHIYLPWVNTCLASYSVSNVRVSVDAINQEKTLVGAFFVES